MEFNPNLQLGTQECFVNVYGKGKVGVYGNYIDWFSLFSCHCVKIVQIWRFFCPYFPAFGMDTDI